MPRRNRRNEAAVEKMLLGDDYKFTRDPEEAARRREARRERAEAARKRARESMHRNWTQCVVPDCKFQVQRNLANGIEFPVCTMHAVAVWADVQAKRDNEYVQQAIEALAARREVIHEEWVREEEEAEREYRARLAEGTVHGDIYFIRANGLIKVGWSADVESRLRSYGPNIEILCVYAGTRRDETSLHRQLTPSRARGREWYHDDKILQAFVDEAVAKHGRPKLRIDWTTPAAVVAGKRATRR